MSSSRRATSSAPSKSKAHSWSIRPSSRPASSARPDPIAGEIVKAFVTVAPGRAPDDQLRLELIGWGRSRLGAVIAPKEIVFEQHLPKTNSGKIMHRLLRARDLGIPEGSPDDL